MGITFPNYGKFGKIAIYQYDSIAYLYHYEKSLLKDANCEILRHLASEWISITWQDDCAGKTGWNLPTIP